MYFVLWFGVVPRRGDLEGPGSWAHDIGLDELNWSSNSNTCGNRNEVLWILKQMVMVLIFWARCYLNLGNTDLFLSYMLQRVGIDLGLLLFLYCFANFLHSPQSVDGHVVKFLIRLNKECWETHGL